MAEPLVLVSVTYEGELRPASLAEVWFEGLPDEVALPATFRQLAHGEAPMSRGFKLRVPSSSPLRRPGFWTALDAEKLGGRFGLRGVVT